MNLTELRVEIMRNGLTNEEFGKKVGLKKNTLYRRFNNTNSFTLKEIRDIAKILNLSETRIKEIFFT